jgi:ribonuclease HIII
MYISFGIYSQSNNVKFEADEDTISCCTYKGETLLEKGQNMLQLFKYVKQLVYSYIYLKRCLNYHFGSPL